MPSAKFAKTLLFAILGLTAMDGCASYCCRPGAASAQSRRIYQANPRWEIEALYPRVQNERIGAALRQFVKSEVKDFKHDIKSAPASPWQSLFYVTYGSTRSEGRVCYKFDSYRFTGGAHGNTTISTFVFDDRTGRQVDYDELFLDDASTWQTLSDLSVTQLESQLGESADRNLISEGAGPSKHNFRHVMLSGDSVVIYFEHFAVAPYSAGQQRVAIPAEELNAVLHSELR